MSQLHCLQQGLDSQTKGNRGRPHLKHSASSLHRDGHIKQGILLGWPGCTGTSRDQLSTDEGLLLMGPHIVILSCLWEEYVDKLHQGHLSATKVLQNARQHLYWPGLDADIIDYMRMYPGMYPSVSPSQRAITSP